VGENWLLCNWCLEAVARPRQLSRDRGRDRGSENCASRLPRGEAVSRGTTSLQFSSIICWDDEFNGRYSVIIIAATPLMLSGEPSSSSSLINQYRVLEQQPTTRAARTRNRHEIASSPNSGYSASTRSLVLPCIHATWLMIWLSGSALVSINVVTLRRARLILGWVTVYTGKPSWYNQPPRSTQPFILPVSINKYRQYVWVKAWESPLSGGR